MENPINSTEELEDVAPLADVEPDFTEESDEDLIRELLAEGYSLAEARRMIGEVEDDDTCYGQDDLDRDVPDFVDDEDFD